MLNQQIPLVTFLFRKISAKKCFLPSYALTRAYISYDIYSKITAYAALCFYPWIVWMKVISKIWSNVLKICERKRAKPYENDLFFTLYFDSYDSYNSLNLCRPEDVSGKMVTTWHSVTPPTVHRISELWTKFGRTTTKAQELTIKLRKEKIIYSHCCLNMI